jgi:hypothetical protein
MPAAKVWPDDSIWNFAKDFGPPDLIIKSPPYTVPAVAQDAWFKPVVETGLTEPRWVRAIEIRPATVKGRKVTHHALARLAPIGERTSSAGRHFRRRRRRFVHGMGRGQAGRTDAAERGQADASRVENHF